MRGKEKAGALKRRPEEFDRVGIQKRKGYTRQGQNQIKCITYALSCIFYYKKTSLSIQKEYKLRKSAVFIKYISISIFL
jgi:hypothetical protein